MSHLLVASPVGRTVLSASTDDAPALEGYKGHGVFTYALLEGMGSADANSNGLIEVTELASWIDQRVPDLSYQAFGQRQVPQMKIVGSNFPVMHQTRVLSEAEPRFACARLSQSYLPKSCSDFSATFTTIAFDDSSLRWLEINT